MGLNEQYNKTFRDPARDEALQQKVEDEMKMNIAEVNPKTFIIAMLMIRNILFFTKLPKAATDMMDEDEDMDVENSMEPPDDIDKTAFIQFQIALRMV